MTLATDLEDIAKRYANRQTERETMQLARIGQGAFRENVLNLWERRCAVTNCDVVEVIVASHCKPWRDCNDGERLDPNNGLPLAATLDALFDRGLIAFDDTGEMLVSPKLSAESKQELGLPRRLRKLPSKELAYFLATHRKALKWVDCA